MDPLQRRKRSWAGDAERPLLAFLLADFSLRNWLPSSSWATSSRPPKAGRWAGEADLLSGYFHTGRCQDLGGGCSWFMATALDDGSPRFRNRKGVNSQNGVLSVELTPEIAPGWRGL